MISVKYLRRCTLAATMLLAACTKVGLVSSDNTPQPKFSDKSKVLVIIVDGLSGLELKKAVPPVLQGMMEHSTYSYESLADSVTNDGASWANILTGVSVAKNNIRDSTLTPRSASGARYAPFLSLVKKSGQRNLKTVSVTGWEQLHKTLLADVVTKVTTKDDDAVVRDSAVAHLKKDSLDLMFAHFNSINKAGRASAFSASSPAYAAAITKVDGYIGSLIDAMKSRPDFANENWLVIVQSTHGGIDNSYGGDSNEEMNCFSLFYCPDLFRHQVDMPQAIKYGVRMYDQGASAVNAVLGDKSMYNFGSTGNYTIECKMRTATAGFTANYPAFLSKRASFDGGVPGWCFFQEGSYWQINFGRKSGGNIQCKGANMNNALWHQLTAVIYTDANKKRWVKTFTDGVFNNRKEITAIGDVTTTAPLTMGYIPGSLGTPENMYMTDVRIWADSLAEDVITKYSCTNVIDASHPYYGKLIGYWPCKERKGGVFRNMAPGARGKDFALQGGYTWDLLDYVLPCAGNIDLQTPPYSSEVFYQIAYWLNLQINPEWEVSGRLWLKFF
ncbi:alkaline phosphatase family protein [Chitinophaga vietnamensis]|uniref:alkaline phosphatase family protein n=1 Tax=Chitinophaga vietnamensis TaxID=2593957 RepID=UPI001375AA35|nr:alkaline phosphatase family protein [Chitinophaga vietnamensis]